MKLEGIPWDWLGCTAKVQNRVKFWAMPYMLNSFCTWQASWSHPNTYSNKWTWTTHSG